MNINIAIILLWLLIGFVFSLLDILMFRNWDIYRIKYLDLIGLAGLMLAGPIAAIVFVIDAATKMDESHHTPD
jgi:uncharacterized membrane protein YuzA (DUF378 family)